MCSFFPSEQNPSRKGQSINTKAWRWSDSPNGPEENGFRMVPGGIFRSISYHGLLAGDLSWCKLMIWFFPLCFTLSSPWHFFSWSDLVLCTFGARFLESSLWCLLPAVWVMSDPIQPLNLLKETGEIPAAKTKVHFSASTRPYRHLRTREFMYTVAHSQKYLEQIGNHFFLHGMAVNREHAISDCF